MERDEKVYVFVDLMVDINIVLVNFFAKEDIGQALESLFLDIKDCPFQVQVTVVDNSSNQDGLKRFLESSYPQVKYIDKGENLGFGKGNNTGFQSTEARYYFALNGDTSFQEGKKTIENIIRFMDSHPQIGCIGPKLLNPDGTLQYSCYRFDISSIFIKPFKQINFDKKYKWVKRHTDHLLMMDFDHHTLRPVDWVLGAALIVRKEVVDSVGWFDEKFFMYMEDCDWCRRMWEKGWPVYYVPEITIIHRHTRQSAQVPGIIKALFKNRLARIHLSSWIKYIWKWRKTYKYF